MIKAKDTYTIDVDTWVNGNTNGKPEDENFKGSSLMTNSRGNMCCLGHICKAHGATNEDMITKAYPDDVFRINPNVVPDFLIDGFGDTNSKFAIEAATINDEKGSLKDRVSKLRELFSTKGIQLKFKGLKKYL